MTTLEDIAIYPPLLEEMANGLDADASTLRDVAEQLKKVNAPAPSTVHTLAASTQSRYEGRDNLYQAMFTFLNPLGTWETAALRLADNPPEQQWIRSWYEQNAFRNSGLYRQAFLPEIRRHQLKLIERLDAAGAEPAGVYFDMEFFNGGIRGNKLSDAMNHSGARAIEDEFGIKWSTVGTDPVMRAKFKAAERYRISRDLRTCAEELINRYGEDFSVSNYSNQCTNIYVRGGSGHWFTQRCAIESSVVWYGGVKDSAEGLPVSPWGGFLRDFMQACANYRSRPNSRLHGWLAPKNDPLTNRNRYQQDPMWDHAAKCACIFSKLTGGRIFFWDDKMDYPTGGYIVSDGNPEAWSDDAALLDHIIEEVNSELSEGGELVVPDINYEAESVILRVGDKVYNVNKDGSGGWA